MFVHFKLFDMTTTNQTTKMEHRHQKKTTTRKNVKIHGKLLQSKLDLWHFIATATTSILHFTFFFFFIFEDIQTAFHEQIVGFQ